MKFRPTVPLLVAAGMLAGCADLFLEPPAKGGPASIALRYSAVGFDAQSSFDQANRVQVRVRGGSLVFDTSFAFTPAPETRARILVPGVEEGTRYTVEVRLLRDEQMMLRATGTHDLLPNSTNTIDMGLTRTPLVSEALALGGLHGCALDEIGEAWCWGRNQVGQMGAGSVDSATHPPTRVPVGGRTFVQIAVNSGRTCALTVAGEVYCWGPAALGTPLQITPPQLEASNPDFVQIGVGYTHICALDKTGLAHCWGAMQNGQLGNGQRATISTPTVVANRTRFKHFIVGGSWNCGVTMDNQPLCWGRNFGKQTGTGSSDTDVLTPLPVQGGLTFTSMMASFNATCGIATTGTFCWGQNFTGAIGNGTEGGTFPTPVGVLGGHTFVSLAGSSVNSGINTMCGLTADGTAFCWGSGHFGELGTTAPRTCTVQPQVPEPFDPPIGCALQPVAVSGGHKFRTIAKGQVFVCGITTTKELYCWGNNSVGQLGTTTATTSTSTPTRVLPGVVLP